MDGTEFSSEFFVIHFDVEESRISLQTFIQSAQSIDKLATEINSIVFNSKLNFQIYVLPPEEGSFLKRLGILISAGATAALSFAATDVGKAFVRGLTGHEPAYWAEESGKLLRGYFIADTDDETDELSKEEINQTSNTCAHILSEATKGFLTGKPSDLQKIGLEMNVHRKAYEARNELYEVCISDSSIQGIGFSKEHQFPISRSKFPELYVHLPPPEEELGLWLVEVAELRITSPNWDRKDLKRKWKGKDSKGHERFFVIEDENFWAHVQQRDLKSNLIDKIQVQWAFREEEGRTVEYKVLRVIEYNDLRIGEPLSPEELGWALGQYTSQSEPKSRQTNLFDPHP